MAEFVGTDNQMRLQKLLRERHSWIAETPGVANGGRLLHFVDPVSVGWERLTELANEDLLAGFPCVDREETVAAIHRHLGPQWKTPVWNAFLGTPQTVLPVCRNLMDEISLPEGCQIEVHSCPSDAQITAIQALNTETGVSPYPAYYSRGEAVPVVTVCISDAQNNLAATASAAYRYHADSRLAGYLFAGMVSVSSLYRRRGLGRLVNATMLVESHNRFGWTMAKEQVAPDNAASQAMIEACGLDNRDGFVSVAAINSGESFSR